ncbi:MAG: glycosyltransferase [Ilumatobacteraceae bacterium]
MAHVARPRWAVAAPFFTATTDRWISDFVSPDLADFVKVTRVGEELSWHHRSTQHSGWKEWAAYGRQAHAALRASNSGVVTVFPQLAIVAALEKRVRRLEVKLVSWFFNTELQTGRREQVCRRVAPAIDRFVVHSTREIDIYSDRLGVDQRRFSFVPLQFGGEVADDPVDDDAPFVFATGSGYRDYATFFRAVERLNLPTKVLAGTRVLTGLRVPSCVEILPQLPKSEIHRLVRQATVNVVPMTTEGANGGLVTIVESFRHGRFVVATDRAGIEDYVHPNENSLVHAPGDAEDLATVIEAAWRDEQLRARLDDGALRFADAHCTDHAAGSALGRILAELD